METRKPQSVDEYIGSFPPETREILEQVRETIRKAAPPGVEEKISYGIPCFTLNGTYLIYFAGYKHHLSLYPAPVTSEEFREDFSVYKTSKGTVQFPLDKAMPLKLITRVVKFMAHQNQLRAAAKGKKNQSKKR